MIVSADCALRSLQNDEKGRGGAAVCSQSMRAKINFIFKETTEMDAKQREIADKIKKILVENLRLPEEDLTDDAKLFGDDIGLDSVDSLEIIAGIDQEFGVSMMGVDREHFQTIETLSKYVMDNLDK